MASAIDDDREVTLPRGYERYRTADPIAAQVAATNFLSAHRLTVRGEPRRFAAVGSIAEAGPVSMCVMSYGEEVAVDRPIQDDPYVAVLIPICGRFLVRLKNTEFVMTPQDSIAAICPRDRLHLRWGKGSRVLALRADTTALQAALKDLSPHAGDSPLQLDSACLAGSQRKALIGIAATLTHVFNSYRPDQRIPRPIIRRLSDHALSTMLLTISHNHHSEMFDPRQVTASRTVRAVIDLVDSEREAQFTVSEFASRLGVSIRAIESAFRRELGTTPTAYLTRTRLERAREELRRGDPRDGITVTDVATKWGFTHVGRFAKRYRQAFGVTPSAQLRNQTR
ncbi:AraC family transcriptional regulator [Mycolicibacterium chlorophenolicum]|uniref:HTH-type transcriptional regulator CdhR n=1 Tax=Mycolicibacterium chlorophenolicum TaxID=37916 RepID=A0A0J6ZG65_9MYCO|nr:AraC family transcriptional regulator [Mycolicibacterium chlorophenolicum]KMO83801.1 HTH-type transcriptional regulator CdhR [Mycolicibacterium chlorophenolicum]